MIRRLAVMTAVVVASLGMAAPVMAYAPVNIVHTEPVTVGPYRLTVGFSVWPLRAMKSLDFTFMPDGGIGGKSGTLRITNTSEKSSGGDSGNGGEQLVRHPRKLDSWGLDVQALDDPGDYTFTFAINGAQGTGTGALTGVTVLDQPGPPLPLSWAVGTLPVWGLIAVIVIAWRRVRPGELPVFT